jgi:hypothetical protein
MAAAVAVVAVAFGARAQPDSGITPHEVDRRTLTSRELDTYFEPYVPAVRACYLKHARGPRATGVLRLELIIHRDGSVFRIGLVAPGLSRADLRSLDRCVRQHASDWHFPVRGGFTTAAIPFFFQRTTASNAGPFPGCASARGCPSRRP